MKVVNMAEKVTATFYDDEHEEWSQKTVTIADILDSVCDDYVVIDTEPKHGHWIFIRDEENNGLYECSVCHSGDIHAKERDVPYCWNCGAKMDK